MNIKKFKQDFSTILDEINYKLFFGSKSLYNSIHKEQYDKEIILEPFSMRVSVDNKCYYDTSFSMWVVVRKNIEGKFEDVIEGKNVDYMQFMLDETKKVFEKINNSEFMIITQKLDEIPVQYYDNETVNSQIMTRSSFPIRIYL